MPRIGDSASENTVLRPKAWKSIAAAADPIRRELARQRRAAEENRAREKAIPDREILGGFYHLVLARNYLERGENDLTSSASLLLMLLASHANADGICYPSRRLLAQGLGISPRATTSALQTLKARYLVEVVQRGYGQPGQTTNRYRLLTPGSGWPRKS